MRTICVFACILSALFSIPASATTWHVEPDSTGQVINIQAGIDSAAAGDTVLVAPGLYVGDGNWNLDFNGKAIVVRSDGGATISSYDYFSEPDYAFYFHSGEDSTSVLEGFHIQYMRIMIDGSSPTIRNNSTYYAGISCENSRAIIENNSIRYYGVGISCRNSRALIKNNSMSYRGHSMSSGCGLCCDSDSSVIIDNGITGNIEMGGVIMSCRDSYNIIRGNFIGIGGGLQCSGGSYVISDNRIAPNDHLAVGLSCTSCNTVISNNQISGSVSTALILNDGTHLISGNSFRGNSNGLGVRFNFVDSNTVFTGNSVCFYGQNYSNVAPRGGIICYHSSPIISDNVIAYTHAGFNYPGRGSGIHCEYSSPHIVRNTIAYNIPFGIPFLVSAGGVTCSNQSSPRIENCIIAYNGYFIPSEPIGYGIACLDVLSVPTILNCNVYGNAEGAYFGIPDQTGINGNFSLAPIFCDPENLEFTLHALSPCLPENNPYGPECGLIGALGMGCDYVATLLQSFDAEYDDSSIEINWTVSDAADISDFDIYRASAPGWEFLAVKEPELDGGGTSFTYRDGDVTPGTAYKYRVSVFDDPAPRVLFETERVNVPSMPLALNQNYPNPFNPITTIAFYLPIAEHVCLDIYDSAGRLVRRLIDEPMREGHSQVEWNGIDDIGGTVASGVYFYRLTAGKQSYAKKMILLK